MIAALFAVLVTSCTSGPDSALDVGMPAYNASGEPGATLAETASTAEATSATDTASLAADSSPTGTAASGAATESTATTTISEGDTTLPAEVALLPVANPVTAFPVVPAEPAQQALATTPPALTEQTGTVAAATDGAATGTPLPAGKPATEPAKDAASADEAAAPQNQVIATAAESPADQPEEPKKKGFLSNLFGSSQAGAAAQPWRQDRDSKPMFAQQSKPKPIIEEQAEPIIDQDEPAQPVLQIATAAPPPSKQIAMASYGDPSALPGVRQTALFEIKRKSGIDDDSDVDLHEDEEDGLPIRLASAAGLARLAPNGLLKQTDKVDVTCLKPSLVRVLKTIERHYGRKIVVTSGYRSPSHNRRARGAKNSLHMYCAAADVQIEGVGKWELASYVRTMPGRGGVGTYCHTESVHVDVGPERDWNWRCRRRK